MMHYINLYQNFCDCHTMYIQCSPHNSNLDNSNSRLLQHVHKVVIRLYKAETTCHMVVTIWNSNYVDYTVIMLITE